MNLQTLSKKDLVGAFRKSLGHLCQDPQGMEVCRWIWENLVEPNQAALKDHQGRIQKLQADRNDQEARLKAFIWNVHEIRKNGSQLFAFHGDKFCKGGSVDELLKAFHEQTSESEK